MKMLLASFSDGQGCAASLAPEAQTFPLLGSAHGGHPFGPYCLDKPDDAVLPDDPRRLVQPGVNRGKATYFNVYWVDCHEGAPTSDAPVKTCGEYRARYQRGKAVMEGGAMVYFGGDNPDASNSLTADAFNNLRKKWGLSERPADFDERLRNRWGVAKSPFHNPYPLPGEDPAKSAGGSGQLPVALSQLRDDEGRYTGKIGLNCHWCHSSEVGLP
jgi:hypothetical protein